MVIYQDKDFKIISTYRNYVLVNKHGKKENHGHFKKVDTCLLMMRLIRKSEVPTSKYLQDAALRISINEKYKKKILSKQNKTKYCYINTNKGARA